MSDCCGVGDVTVDVPMKHRCPVNGAEYGRVHVKTILHHIREPWTVPVTDQGYYFCSDSNCDVVYFGQDDSVYPKSVIRTKVGIKDSGPEELVCYCFGVTRREAERNSTIKEYVVAKTKASLCSCETSNPSGRCCLKKFP